jgi:hypothetical protein
VTRAASSAGPESLSVLVRIGGEALRVPLALESEAGIATPSFECAAIGHGPLELGVQVARLLRDDFHGGHRGRVEVQLG